MPVDITITAEEIFLEDYLSLVEDVGWSRFVKKSSVRTALKNSLFSVVARCGSEVVGAGRIVGDGAIFFYIQDVMVRKAYRKKGIGTAIVAALCEHLRREAPGSSYVGLFTHPTKCGFYERFGFHGPKPALIGMFKGTKKKPNFESSTSRCREVGLPLNKPGR